MQVLRRNFDDLRQLFQYFSSHGGGDITHMNSMEFLYFCHVCKLVDRETTPTEVDRVFRRVNVEEVPNVFQIA